MNSDIKTWGWKHSTPQKAHPHLEKTLDEKTPKLKLSERNIQLVNMFSTTGATLEKVGKAFGITRERARQILLKHIRPEDIRRIREDRIKKVHQRKQHPCAFCGKEGIIGTKYCSRSCKSNGQIRAGEERRRKRSNDPRLFPGKPVHSLTGDEKRAFQAARTTLWYREHKDLMKERMKEWQKRYPYRQSLLVRRVYLKKMGLPMIPNPYSDVGVRGELKALSNDLGESFENLVRAYAFLFIRQRICNTNELEKLYTLVTGNHPSEEQIFRLKYVNDLLLPLRANRTNRIAKMPSSSVWEVILDELEAVNPTLRVLFGKWMDYVEGYLGVRQRSTRS